MVYKDDYWQRDLNAISSQIKDEDFEWYCRKMTKKTGFRYKIVHTFVREDEFRKRRETMNWDIFLNG